MKYDPGSYRDPSGRIFIHNSEIYRAISPSASSWVKKLFSEGLVDNFTKEGYLIPSKLISAPDPGMPIAPGGLLIKHQKLPMISYPYEWSFEQLKTAALFHLDLHLLLLKKGWTLSDATAYNIQFAGKGCKPVFIDLLSIVRYEEGSYWLAQSQFCTQFLAPLVLSSKKNIDFNNWYKGNIEGISLEDLSAVLPWNCWLSPTLLMNVLLPAYFQGKKTSNRQTGNSKTAAIMKNSFPKNALISSLKRLKSYITKLKNNSNTLWCDYSGENSYTNEATRVKNKFIETFCRKNEGKSLWDLGCNNGVYSQIALESGMKRVVGFDFDAGSICQAYDRAKTNLLDFLPLHFDAANPSPSMGWRQQERQGLMERANADCLIALAFIHHICIARNVPISQAVEWFLQLAPEGVIEFVGKEDVTVKEMLALREDIFQDYTYDSFRHTITAYANIIAETAVPNSDRTLVHYAVKNDAQKLV